MTRTRISRRLLAGLTLTAGLGHAASAQAPKVEEILARKPVHASAVVSTPAGPELAACKVEVVPYPAPATGYKLVDGQGRLVRQFIDTAGRGKPNIAYFYLNGAEAYREIDGSPRQFRWLGANGGRWGGDVDGDGSVDVWYDISPAEASQELFAAIMTKDAKRFQALLVTPEELKSLKLPDSEMAKISARAAGATKKFQDAIAAMPMAPTARWLHAEMGLPNVAPMDSLRSATDLVRLPTVTVLYESGPNKADLFQVGDMVQVGRAWRLIDGPTAGAATGPSEGTGGITVPDSVKQFLPQIDQVKLPSGPADAARYHLERAAILEKIVAATQGEQQQPWLKQTVDSYAAAAESSGPDSPGLTRLRQLVGPIEKDAPKSVASYAAFRLLAAEYTVRMTAAAQDPAKASERSNEVQKWWREQLEGYVTRYPAGEDAAEAMMRLAVAHEFAGKDGEEAAKKWYDKLAASFPGDYRAAKAAGAVKRLQSEGQALTLPPSSTLDGKPFDVGQLAGKPAVVFYYANWSTDPAAEARLQDDLKKLAEAAKPMLAKGLTVVTISLDETKERAAAAIQAAQVPGLHLHAAGGLDRSPLAVAYGVQMVPHLMLVGKDGKVTNRAAQISPSLKDELEKLAK